MGSTGIERERRGGASREEAGGEKMWRRSVGRRRPALGKEEEAGAWQVENRSRFGFAVGGL